MRCPQALLPCHLTRWSRTPKGPLGKWSYQWFNYIFILFRITSGYNSSNFHALKPIFITFMVCILHSLHSLVTTLYSSFCCQRRSPLFMCGYSICLLLVHIKSIKTGKTQGGFHCEIVTGNAMYLSLRLALHVSTEQGNGQF